VFGIETQHGSGLQEMGVIFEKRVGTLDIGDRAH
jgi:hypothetical protein